jgi:hypothetical protein
LVGELNKGEFSTALIKAEEIESKHSSLVLLSALLPFLSSSALPHVPEPQSSTPFQTSGPPSQFEANVMRGLFAMKVLSKSLNTLRGSALRFEAASLAREQWGGLVAWMRLFVSLNRCRDMCVSFFIELLLLDHGTLDCQEIMASQASISLMFSLFAPHGGTFPSDSVRWTTSSIFLAFTFFANTHAIIHIRARLQEHPRKLRSTIGRLKSLITALSSCRRDQTAQIPVQRSLPPAEAINTATQCVTIIYGLLDVVAEDSTLLRISRMIRYLVRFVFHISGEGEEPSPSGPLLSAVVDFLEFTTRWTNAEAFRGDPIRPVRVLLDGGVLSLLVFVLKHRPENQETCDAALT